MKYITQLSLILGITLLGEVLQRVLPVSIPAAVYGLALLFLALSTGLIKLDQVKETGDFLRSLLPLLFVGPTVGILEHWQLIRQELIPLVTVILVSTTVTYVVSGLVTQRLNKKEGDEK